MDLKNQYLCLCLVRSGAAKDIDVKDRFTLLSDKLVSFDGDGFLLTDKGKDRLARKGK